MGLDEQAERVHIAFLDSLHPFNFRLDRFGSGQRIVS
jgi:hypothetical protein